VQNAYDRLRKYGTEYYEYMPTTPNYPLPSSPLITTDITNGFFVRDDVPYWDYIFPGYAPTAKYYNHFNRPYLVNTLPYKAVTSSTQGSFFNAWRGTNPANLHAVRPYVPTSNPSSESQDQMNQIYMGEQALIQFLDGSDPFVMSLRTRAENALYHTMKSLEYHEGSPWLFYSIPDPLNPARCVNDDCSSDGFFYNSSFPAMFGLRGFLARAGSPLLPYANTLQDDCNNASAYYYYANTMVANPLCCSYALQNIAYADGFSCYGPEYAGFITGTGLLGLPIFNYLIWRSSSTASKRTST